MKISRRIILTGMKLAKTKKRMISTQMVNFLYKLLNYCILKSNFFPEDADETTEKVGEAGGDDAEGEKNF